MTVPKVYFTHYPQVIKHGSKTLPRLIPAGDQEKIPRAQHILRKGSKPEDHRESPSSHGHPSHSQSGADEQTHQEVGKEGRTSSPRKRGAFPDSHGISDGDLGGFHPARCGYCSFHDGFLLHIVMLLCWRLHGLRALLHLAKLVYSSANC